MHVSDSFLIYFHMRPETDRRISESMCPAYMVVGHIRSVPHGRKKIGIGSLEPCSVNAAKVTYILDALGVSGLGKGMRRGLSSAGEWAFY